MRITGICGSPRGEKSQTKILLINFLNTCKEKGFDTEIIDLSKYKVSFCLACEVCHQQFDCPLKDDRNLIVKKNAFI
jgi:multimeric flavodoxin WrbA